MKRRVTNLGILALSLMLVACGIFNGGVESKTPASLGVGTNVFLYTPLEAQQLNSTQNGFDDCVIGPGQIQVTRQTRWFNDPLWEVEGSQGTTTTCDSSRPILVKDKPLNTAFEGQAKGAAEAATRTAVAEGVWQECVSPTPTPRLPGQTK